MLYHSNKPNKILHCVVVNLQSAHPLSHQPRDYARHLYRMPLPIKAQILRQLPIARRLLANGIGAYAAFGRFWAGIDSLITGYKKCHILLNIALNMLCRPLIEQA